MNYSKKWTWKVGTTFIRFNIKRNVWYTMKLCQKCFFTFYLLYWDNFSDRRFRFFLILIRNFRIPYSYSLKRYESELSVVCRLWSQIFKSSYWKVVWVSAWSAHMCCTCTEEANLKRYVIPGCPDVNYKFIKIIYFLLM